MDILVKNIKGLVQVHSLVIPKRKGQDLNELPVLENSFLHIKDGRFHQYGLMEHMPDGIIADIETDAYERFVLPTWVDPHTHIVFPASREEEFLLKLKGASYEEIAAAGGGILNSAERLRKMSEEELLAGAMKRIDEVIKMGTGAIEIKSGYGLSVEAELKMLRVIKKLKELVPVTIKATFLGAHAVPREFRNDKKGYIKLIVNEMLPEISDKNLADYVDVFIEKGFYSTEDAEEILEASISYGLKPRLHVDQMSNTGGVVTGLKYGAVSLDHLENTSDKSVKIMAQSESVPVLLPSCSFYLNMQYPPARKMIQAGLPLALATDFNPGSSPSGNMNFVISLACIKMRMTPAEAINAATINAAYALEIEKTHGAIIPGFPANFIITEKITSLNYLPYSFGRHCIERVFLHGIEY